MTPEIIFLLLILCAIVFTIFTERLPIDLAALSALLILTILGFLTPEEAFSGFSSPATITMLATFFVAAALERTGIADLLARSVYNMAGRSEIKNVAVVMVISASVSAFINNLSATALLLPAVVSIAHNAALPVSRLLMPFVFSVLLGGTTTLIGTQPNILASELLRVRGLEPFHFFDFTPLGISLLIAGVIFFLLLGRRMLPQREGHAKRRAKRALPQVYNLHQNVFSCRLPPGSSLAGKTLAQARLGTILEAQVLAVRSHGKQYLAPDAEFVLSASDELILGGTRENLDRLLKNQEIGIREISKGELEGQLELLSAGAHLDLESGEVGIVEAALSPRSSLIRKTIAEMQFRERYGLQVLAIWKGGRPYRSKLAERKLSFGDALLLQGPRDKFKLLVNDPDFLILSESLIPPRRLEKGHIALFGLLLMVGLTLSGIQPIQVSSFIAAVLVVLLGALTMEEAYRAIEWRIYFFVAALLPLGLAVEKSGLTELFSSSLVSLYSSFSLLGPYPIMLSLGIMACLISQALDSILALVLLGPVAISVAQALGLNPHPFLMVTTISVSFAFLSPYSHRANLLIMGTGGYRARDFLRVGGALTIVVFLSLLLLVPKFFPF